MKRMNSWFAAVLCCVMTMAVFTACVNDSSDNPVNPIPSDDEGTIVGNWCSDVSGLTYAKWNYDKTWQNTEFRADGTGCTRIYYTLGDKAIGIEKIDFTYTASADGALTMTPSDREAMAANWQIAGGELRISNGDNLSLNDMAAKFDEWSKTKDVFDVPQPAKHTIFVYGNAGGGMDKFIEYGFWERAKEFLTNHNNVRVICFYKYGMDQSEYGKPFSGKYAEPGDIVWFELNDQTDLNKIKEEGFQAHGLGDLAKLLQICNPNTMRLFLECSSLVCPAEKYSIFQSKTRGVMSDEWLKGEWMDMYEMYDAVKAAGIDRLNTLYFHNCFMGNIESLTQAREFADYIVASAHVLCSDGQILTEFVRGLVETGNAEEAAGLMFERCTPTWQNGYIEESDENSPNNGDFKMIRMDKFDAIIDASKRLCDRIMALYPTQKDAIDRATRGVYRYSPVVRFEDMVIEYVHSFFDIANYAQLLAKESGDTELKAISAAMDQAFKEAFVHYRDISNSKEHLDHYTLSVCLLNHDIYVNDFKSWNTLIEYNYNEGYEQCDFHKLTGWGNWLNMNQQSVDSNPETGGGGKLE